MASESGLRILVVDDEESILDFVEMGLEYEGFEVERAQDGPSALAAYDRRRPHLIVLDLNLPGLDGLEVCRRLRQSSDVPIIMLTARDDETSVVVGLEVGADDYITKPFSPRQLVSRVRAHLRRRRLDANVAAGEPRKIEFPGLEIDLLRRQVHAWGTLVELTAKEYEVLVLLAAHPGRVYNREQIMRHLWNGDFFGEARAADVHVQHIRKKIENDPKNPRYVQTVRGMGYRFAEL